MKNIRVKQRKQQITEDDKDDEVLRIPEKDRYEVIEVLGEGTYGKVYLVEKDNQQFAIKRFLNPSKCSNIKGVMAVRELDFVARLNSPYINTAVKFIYGVPFTELRTPHKNMIDDKVYTVMPLALYSGHDLRKREYVSYVQLKRFMYQLLQGIYYMHSYHICHRDVKPGNILIFNGQVPGLMEAKWTDFGMCKHLTSEDNNSTYVSTSIYKPPELLMKNEAYDYKFDIWSLGCTFYELVARDDLFSGNGDLNVLKNIFKMRGVPNMNGYREIAGEKPMWPYKMFKGKKIKLHKILSLDNFEQDDFNNNTTAAYIPQNKSSDSDYDSEEDEDKNEHHKIDEKEKNNKENTIENTTENGLKLPQFGTFDQFIDLLEHMLVITPSERYSAWDCLQHPFFEDIPEEDPTGEWYGLVKQKPIEIKHHIIKKIKNKDVRTHGIDVIKHISTTFADNAYRIIFLGLDIYDRCLLAIEQTLREKQSEEQNTKIKKKNIIWPKQGKDADKYDYRLLAASSCYLACKYFMDEETPRLNKLFPTLKFLTKNIINMEKNILELYLHYKIYRTTIFDTLHTKIETEKLFALLMDQDDVYGFDIKEIKDTWNEELFNK